jgi:predicted component of type VI protein secretion system
MFYCRLFHRDHPFEQIDARLIEGGKITVGRDPAADWRLDDADGTLSRIHCTLALENGRLTLRDHSTNGTYLEDGRRPAPDEDVELVERSSFRLGAHTILVTAPPQAQPAVEETLPIGPAADWTDALPVRAPHRDASLIEAFCRGAGLDASALSSEDPVELMERIGAIYQQTVLGLSALMAERARAKGEYELERTTIRAAQNNPFKWAPSRKLAQDLLRTAQDGFLSDARAVRASFEDLGGHLTALSAGTQAAVAATAEALAPETVEAEAKEQASLLRNRAAICWELHSRRHAALTQAGGFEVLAKRAFAEAYLRSLPDSPK